MNVIQISRKPARGQFSLERLRKISSKEFEKNSVSNLVLHIVAKELSIK